MGIVIYNSCNMASDTLKSKAFESVIETKICVTHGEHPSMPRIPNLIILVSRPQDGSHVSQHCDIAHGIALHSKQILDSCYSLGIKLHTQITTGILLQIFFSFTKIGRFSTVKRQQVGNWKKRVIRIIGSKVFCQ